MHSEGLAQTSRRRGWAFGLDLVAAACILALYSGSADLASTFAFRVLDPDGMAAIQAIKGLITAASVLLVVPILYALHRLERIPPEPDLSARMGKAIAVAWAVCIGLAIAMAMTPGAQDVGPRVGDHPLLVSTLQMAVSQGDWLTPVFVMASLCVATPIVEELVFRQAMFSVLRRHGLWTTVAITAMAFASVHRWDPPTLMIVTLGGVILAMTREHFGLRASVILHAMYNGTLLLIAAGLALVLPSPFA